MATALKVILFTLLLIFGIMLKEVAYRGKNPSFWEWHYSQIERWLYRRRQKKEVEALRKRLRKQIEDRQSLNDKPDN